MTAKPLTPESGNAASNPHSPLSGSKHERHDHLLDREPDFHAFYRSYTRRALTLCLIAIPVGIVMKLPVVWGLAMLGVVVTVYRLYFAGTRRN